jgi:hypothetical protein
MRDAHYWDAGYQEYEPERTANNQDQEAKEVTMTEEAESENTSDISNNISKNTSSNTSNHTEETITTPRALTGPRLA